VKWRRSQGVYHSDCGRFSIKKHPTHDAKGNIMERYPWWLSKGKTVKCCFATLWEAKEGAERWYK